MCGLEFLGKKGILHRDLKPENIMLTKEEGKEPQARNFKICDFGLATYEHVTSYLYKRCGTPGYVAPEIVKADVNDNSFRATPKCDTFSAGVLLYLLLSKIRFIASWQYSFSVFRYEGDFSKDSRVQNQL